MKRIGRLLGHMLAADDFALRGSQCASLPTVDTPATFKIDAASLTSRESCTTSHEPEVGTWLLISQTKPFRAKVYMGERRWRIVSSKDSPAFMTPSCWKALTALAAA